jgi:AcrR family transcriptional regulator
MPRRRTGVKSNIDDVNMTERSMMMKLKAARRATATGEPPRRVRKPRRPPTYHHGSLKQAMLQAAERILEREGIQGLTLRAAAREAGVSHAAPKNHFGDLSGLLSELAAVGFARFVATMQAGTRDGDPPAERMAAIGRGYVAFARAHPGLFLLMFRGERLNMSRPALREAVEASRRVLMGAVAASRNEPVEARLTLPQAADIVAAWSLVHGFAMLLIDGRLEPLLARLPPGTDADALLGAVFGRR